MTYRQQAEHYLYNFIHNLRNKNQVEFGFSTIYPTLHFDSLNLSEKFSTRSLVSDHNSVEYLAFGYVAGSIATETFFWINLRSRLDRVLSSRKCWFSTPARSKRFVFLALTLNEKSGSWKSKQTRDAMCFESSQMRDSNWSSKES